MLLLYRSKKKRVKIMGLVENVLRKAKIGVWQYMPYTEGFVPKSNTGGLNRVNPDSMWRVGSRRELVESYDTTIHRMYKNLAFTILGAFVALIGFNGFQVSGDMTMAGVAILGAAIVSRYYTKAWGGYAEGWSDYEHDPVRVLPHNAYVLNQNTGMI